MTEWKSQQKHSYGSYTSFATRWKSVMFQPIHIIRLDERTGNLFILAGREETIEFEVDNKGELVDEQI